MHLALGGCLKAPPVSYGITPDTGGHIAYILEAASHQVRRNDVSQVIIVTRRFDDPRFNHVHNMTTEEFGDKIHIVRVGTDKKHYVEKEELAAELSSFTQGLIEYLSSCPSRPDVIHAHFADAAQVASVIQKRFGIAFVFTPHSLGIDKQAQGVTCSGLDQRIAGERSAIANAGAIIVSTSDEADRQIGAYCQSAKRKIHVIPPGVPRLPIPNDKRRVRALLESWFERPHLPIILAISRPVTKKNLASLLRAYARDETLQRQANLVILAGQHGHAAGEERANLDQLIEMVDAYGLRDRVALPPAHDAHDVAALYAYAAQGGVFVSPALHEPFGLTLIEAAAFGTPVVATRNGGPAEIVAAIGHGALIDPRDVEAIGRSIKAIIGDAGRHAMLSAKANAGVGRYCWDRYASASISIYRSLARPQLLACDMDNTLTGCRHAAGMFRAWRSSSSMPFVVATGRSLHATKMILRRWQLPEPDAYIVDVGTRIVLPDGQGEWQECAEFAAYLDQGWDRGAVTRLIAPLRLKAQPPVTEGPHKISFFGTACDAANIRKILSKNGVAAKVVFSHGRLIDILAPNGGKAEAIAAYARKLGLSLSDCVAAGDSGNDADMLTACGHAIIVGNATAELEDIPARNGLIRVAEHHAAGVLEGLALLGLCERGAPAVADAA
jgi:sucrose-phosphate synthase